MTNLIRSNFQDHPFHLVSPSPWPLYTSICLLNLTTSAALSMHNFSNAYYLFYVALLLLISSMSFWFRDIISEGKQIFLKNSELYISRIIKKDEIDKIKEANLNKPFISNKQLGHYLAGLLEGDGSMNLPFLGKTILNRILNPRIVFTSHVNNLALYINIQSALGGIGRFQLTGKNTIRYIIGDIGGINIFIHVIHGKLRTPKNKTFNQLINFLNLKYNWDIPKSELDNSPFSSNSWLTGFTEADGYFGVKILEFKPKQENVRLRSSSQSISLKFVLVQRLHDKKTNLSMFNIMEELSKYLSCNLSSYKVKDKHEEYLSINISSIDKLKSIANYFNNHPLWGIKGRDFQDWLKVYNMILNKEHLTESGREKIKLIKSNMNKERIEETILKSSISLPYLIVSVIILMIMNFILDINLFNINLPDLNSIMVIAEDTSNSIKGTVEAKNLKVENLDVAVEKIRDGSIYIGGMVAAGKIVKGSTLPITAKLGATVGMGAASLVGYHMVQKNLGNRTQPINIKAENINTTVTGTNNDLTRNLVQSNNSEENSKDLLISLLDVEQLQLDFYLHIIMLYLFTILFVIIIMKFLSKKDTNFEFVLKLPFGNFIQKFLIIVFKWWDKTNDFWIYSILISIFISLIISAWSIDIIINNIH